VALLDLSEALMQSGQNQRAAELLKTGPGDDPLLLYQGGEFEKALALDPDMAQAHNEWGEQLASAGQMDRAEAEFRAALSAEPDLPAAQSNLGHALAGRGELGEAAWYFERAVRHNPNDADTHVNYATTLMGLKRPDEALREYDAALKLRPDFGLAHVSAAVILGARGDLAAARIHLEQAAKDSDANIRQRAVQMLSRLPR
jgi:Tfp pilus assembly protein PilF